MESAIISVIGGILIRLIFPEPIVMIRSGEPDFLSNIPPAHYVGISSEHRDLTAAKEEALLDAVKQIFLRIGSEYHLEFDKTAISQNHKMDIRVQDNINIGTGGILTDIEVRKLCVKKKKGRCRVYALVFIDQSRIVYTRKMIAKENDKRMAYFHSYIDQGNASKEASAYEEALRHYRFALGLTDDLFSRKKPCKSLAESHIDETLELIRIRESKIREIILRKPVIRVSPLTVTDKCFAFEISESNGKAVEFSTYEVYISARYKLAPLVSYYIMNVDKQKDISRSFDLIQPISVNANSTKVVMIPINSWVSEKTESFNMWYMGSSLRYRIVLKGNCDPTTIQ